MPKYEVSARESNYLLTGKSDVTEQKYDAFKELSLKEIRENRDVLEQISLEAYARVSSSWMKFLNDDDFEKFYSKLKEKIVIDINKFEFEREIKDEERDVARDVLRSYMFAILELSRKFDEPYYRMAIAYYRGSSTPLLFTPEVYDQEPHEVNYDEEFKRNNGFWLGEIVEYLCSLYRKATEEQLMPFVSSTILNRAKEYFLKFEDSKSVAKKVIDKIKYEARR